MFTLHSSQVVNPLMSNSSTFPVIRGRPIHVDEKGFVCLNDIWNAAGFSKNQRPTDWKELPVTANLMIALMEQNSGKSGVMNYDAKSVIYSKSGKGGGTFADVRLALKYAEYLSPKLAIEVADVFLRYKVADPTLADDVLARATPEANEWAGTRALARSVRVGYTDVLKQHGCRQHDYPACTNALYTTLFNKDAKQLKRSKNLPVRSNLRDGMSTSELVYVMAGETLAAERIEDEACTNGIQCQAATIKSASRIRDAFNADRADRRGRQQKLL